MTQMLAPVDDDGADEVSYVTLGLSMSFSVSMAEYLDDGVDETLVFSSPCSGE